MAKELARHELTESRGRTTRLEVGPLLSFIFNEGTEDQRGDITCLRSHSSTQRRDLSPDKLAWKS